MASNSLLHSQIFENLRHTIWHLIHAAHNNVNIYRSTVILATTTHVLQLIYLHECSTRLCVYFHHKSQYFHFRLLETKLFATIRKCTITNQLATIDRQLCENKTYLPIFGLLNGVLDIPSMDGVLSVP